MARARRAPDPPVDVVQWGHDVEPDFLGKTASGLWFALITWKRGEPFYALGYGKSSEEALAQSRVLAMTTRLQAGKG